MKASAIYETYEGFEERAAEIYVLLSQHFTPNTRLSWFWAEMALEELQHSSTLRFCREYALFTAEGLSEESVGRITALLERAVAAGSKPELTVAEAFDLALEIEASELDDVYEKLTRGLYGPYPFLQEAFHLGYGDHLRRFAKAIVEFCDDASLAEKFELLARKHAV